MQMKYFFPIIVFFISYHLAGVIALYWFVSNLFTIGQELVVRRKIQA
jgi:membrane protein insertase Oxa1/YidC/SpoIIIJ